MVFYGRTHLESETTHKTEGAGAGASGDIWWDHGTEVPYLNELVREDVVADGGSDGVTCDLDEPGRHQVATAQASHQPCSIAGFPYCFTHDD